MSDPVYTPTVFVSSLKRLYMAERITLAKLGTLLADAKIDQTDYDYVIT